MYNSDQIQDMITTLKSDNARLKIFCERLEKVNADDRIAIMDVIRDGWYERFDRYDSDVCETFIRLYEEVME